MAVEQKKQCFWQSTMKLGLVVMFLGFVLLPESIEVHRISPGWDTFAQISGCVMVVLGLAGTTARIVARRRELMKELHNPSEA